MKPKAWVQGHDRKEKPTFLAVVEPTEGHVYLAVVDQDGKPVEGGHLLRILPDGRLLMCIRVDPTLGFQVDERGQVLVSRFGVAHPDGELTGTSFRAADGTLVRKGK